MQEPITICTKITARVTEDDGQCFSVIMIVTRGLTATRVLTSAPAPLSAAQTLHVVLVEDTERGHGQPDGGALDPVLR